MPYHTNHATFELPAQLKDKTMHMFTLADEGPSEFSVVMSHADAQGDDSLVNFADRLVAELGNSLPDFRRKRRLSAVLSRPSSWVMIASHRWEAACF